MKKHLPFLLILAIGIGLRLYWWSATQFTEEDAYITFQFARGVAERNEFALNPGDVIYGSTTPLLTLLLSVVYEFGVDLAVGAKVISLLAFTGGLTFLYLSFRGSAQWIAPILVATSTLLIAQDMSGMEMSLLFFFMMGALRGMTTKDPLLSGLMCAFLLWTRIDTVVFVAVMALAHYLDNKSVVKFMIGTSAYVPWLLFAWWYFDSPLPFTITAKQVAYGTGWGSYALVWVHLGRIVDYLSIPLLIASAIAIFYSGRRTFFLSLFLLFEIAWLELSGSTFFPRYFYMLTVACLIVVALAIAKSKPTALTIALSLLAVVLSYRADWINSYRYTQEHRHTTLREIGEWFHQNTPLGSTVQLEPLGYVGYYSQRIMLDEVGLVTPLAVELHRNRIGGHDFWRYLRTDYVLYQCHQADRVLEEFQKEYTLIHVFESTAFRECYEVWEKHE